MEDSRSPAEQVIAALRERNISFKQSDIESAFNDESLGFANAQWASEHLGYDTLLSREELTLYDALSVHSFSLSFLLIRSIDMQS